MIVVAAFYRFAPFEDLKAIQLPLLELCRSHGLKGTILLATEGVNGTIAGSSEAITAAVAHIGSLPGCDDLDVKYSSAPSMPFKRMKVRLKKEIVTLGIAGIDPSRNAGRYVDASEWNKLISDPDTIVIDTRNDFEVAMGTFDGAINPNIAKFGDFPAWFREHRSEFGEHPRVAMFCTGGIRCEKSTAFLRAEGIDDVAHLHGGILRYLEEVPVHESMWKGECFVFDERVTLVHGLERGTSPRPEPPTSQD